MVRSDYGEKTKDLVLASDNVLFATQRWGANSTLENHIALLVAKVEYLQSEISLAVFLRERLEARVKALEERTATGSVRKRASSPAQRKRRQ